MTTFQMSIDLFAPPPPSDADMLELQKAIARQGGIKPGEIVDFDMDGGRTFSAHAVHDDAGFQNISLVLADADEGTLLDSAGRLIISGGGLGFAGVKRIGDAGFHRGRLLHVLGALYGERIKTRARAKCHSNEALRALLDPVSREDRLKLGFERPRTYKFDPDLRYLDDLNTRLNRRAVSPVVWRAFEAACDDDDGQDRLARAFGIDIYKWKETATLARMRGLWKLISDDPFPRS